MSPLSCFRPLATTVFLMFVMGWIQTGAISSVCAFQDGANGADGADGDPGANGDDGEGGLDVIAIQNGGWAISRGGTGGDGGKGGAGIDSVDPDGTANGGHGGHGGRAGRATASHANPQALYLNRAAATGGDGGSGGMFGIGTSTPLNGTGGNGANGGDARATAHGAAYTGFARAIGGRGGDAYGPQATAGNGGEVSTGITVRPQFNFNFPSLELEETGGTGGDGFLGATGGDGASVDFGIDENFVIENPAPDKNYSISLTGYGGRGGGSVDGMVGSGGSASTDLDGLFQQLWPDEMPASFGLNVTLHGGYGGKGNATGNQNVSGADGSAAFVTGNQVHSSLGKAKFYFDLRGGNGGSALGAKNSGDGGNGAVAMIESIKIEQSSSPLSSNPTAWVDVVLTGGDGGHASGSGQAGDGAAVEFRNSIDINNRHYASIDVTLNGGSGGRGEFNGDGGSAVVEADQAIIDQPIAIEGTFGNNQIELTAIGGNAGLGVAGTNRADAGDAWASAVQQSPNRLWMSTHATGGAGNRGKSGDAFARTHATTFDEAVPGFLPTATALATADTQFASDRRIRASHGSNAVAEATAIVNSQADAIATARAFGGWGFRESGKATATARAETRGGPGNGVARSNATSIARSDRDASTENYATSIAFSKSDGDGATSHAVARSSGHFSRAQATAGINARVGLAYSEVSTNTTNWAHQAKIRNAIVWEAAEMPALDIDSSSFAGFRQTGFADAMGKESTVNLLVIPDAPFAHSMIGGSGLDGVFGANSDADILGLGQFAGGLGAEGIEGYLETVASIDLSLRLQPFHDDKSMMLGFFGVESTGSGFEKMSFSLAYRNESIFEETFTSLLDATSFLDDALFNLGALDNLETLVDFEFDFSMTSTDSSDSFGFGFIFGNADEGFPSVLFGNASGQGGGTSGHHGFSAVPEPTSGMAAGLFVLGLTFSRRRRKSSNA